MSEGKETFLEKMKANGTIFELNFRELAYDGANGDADALIQGKVLNKKLLKITAAK